MPHSLTAVHGPWRKYVEENVLDVQLVRSEVAASWERCHQLGLDPFRPPDGCVDRQLLRDRAHQKRRLIRVARPFMENLYNFVKGSGFEVVLTDESGFLLEVLGDEDVVSKTQHVDLCPGGDWSEAAKGTNAIGTVIVERHPVQIYAWEHYCQANHFLTCSASPIFDPDGELIGALDVSGDYRFANSHTLGMVVAAVNAIENQLRFQKASEKLYMAYRYSNILLQNMSDGLISIDNNGIVTEINAKAGEIFGINPVAVKGRHVTQVYNGASPQLLSGGMDYEGREIVVEKLGKKISSSASVLRDDSGATIGAVAVFREIITPSGLQAASKKSGTTRHYTFDDIVGQSPAIAALKEWARLAATSPSTVLIKGESGTGKELFAQAVHNASARRNRPFIAINSAALPEHLIESELFGYEDGAFTGSRRGGKPGKFEIADGGTVFLDEIGDMPLSVQAKLLRVIQEKKVARIGSAHEKHVDIRFIAATHKDLKAETDQGRFRQDLFYRLNVLEIVIPPLRARMEDIPLLARHLTDKISARFGTGPLCIEQDFLTKLHSYTWPGNVRELENAIERAIIRAGAVGALTGELLDSPSAEPPKPVVKTAALISLREAERAIIAEALAFFEGNIQKTAAKLGIGRNTLYRKMKEYGLSIA
ncbi:MAG TPA: sigma-54-dependent Fis family transcriptional regulator [Terriglobales bacterium]|nr:sigma-54-dependent Fis family transcriptional regulator [Terriglobales bacterium]